MRYKVNADALKIGMYVAELDRPWAGSPFLFQGFLIESQEDLDQLKATCAHVFVDDKQSTVPVADIGKPVTAAGTDLADKNAASLTLSPNQRGAAGDSGRLTETGVAAQQSVGRVLASAKTGGNFDASESKAVVARLVRQSTNPNAIMQLAKLHDKQDRHTSHSLSTAMVAIAFGRHLGVVEETLQLLGLGAMLHDIGKARISPAILDKPGKLTEAEYAIVKQHPVDGYEMLKASGQVADEVLDIVRFHHERLDGSGYPKGLQGDDIPQMARITAIADTYEMLTTDNPYQSAITSVEAVQRLRSDGTGKYGEQLIQEFIRFIGLYPIGSLVQLNMGGLAVVMSSDPKKRLRPLVMMFRDEHGKDIRPRRLLNLAMLPEDKLTIREVVDPKKHGVDLSALLAEELAR